MAEEAERSSSIRAELQRLGVAKVDLAYRAVKDDVQRRDDGQLIARSGPGEVPLRDYLNAIRAGESRTAAGAHHGRIRNGIGIEGGLEYGRSGSGQDSAGHESGRTGEGSPGGLEGGESSAARHVRRAPGEAVEKERVAR